MVDMRIQLVRDFLGDSVPLNGYLLYQPVCTFKSITDKQLLLSYNALIYLYYIKYHILQIDRNMVTSYYAKVDHSKYIIP